MTTFVNSKLRILQFQLTRSRGAWPIKILWQQGHIWFQLTRSRGAWLWTCIVPVCSALFQLTRSRGAWPALASCVTSTRQISTHTLTWSVTIFWVRYQKIGQISTHTLTWSVTLQGFSALQHHCHFNSHAHVERDKIERRVKIIENISTHTLTWSVTLDVMWNFLKLRISTHTLTWSVTKANLRLNQLKKFQLTRSRGAWRGFATGTNYQEAFQLTRPRGAWLFVSLIKLSDLSNFNSHAHVERDALFLHRISVYTHFNSHAHVERDMIVLI